MYMLGEQTVAWPLLKNWRAGGNWHAQLPEKQWYYGGLSIYTSWTLWVVKVKFILYVPWLKFYLDGKTPSFFSSSMNINIYNQVAVSHTPLIGVDAMNIINVWIWLEPLTYTKQCLQMLLIMSRIAIQSSWISASCPIILYTEDPNFNFNPLDVGV